MLYLVRMRQEGEDRSWWVPSKIGLFGVKSFYSVMSCHHVFHFPWKSVEDNSSVEGGILCVVGRPKEDPYHRQFS
jgi:hypothetical protein